MADVVVGWVSGPTERGTLTLVWSCVITIFACTWTVLHLNVPGREDTSSTIALRKAKWMAINILFPEFVFSKAICDLRLALQELQEFDEYLQHNNKTIEWTTHYITFDIKWIWEIEYPDGWSGLLYDLLRLKRPPVHLLRNRSPLRRFLRKCIFGLLSASTQPKNTTFELGSVRCSSFQSDLRTKGKSQGDRQPRHGMAAEDHRQTSMEQDIVSPTTQGSLELTRTISQKWTVVHSYYAQMGGLVFPASLESLEQNTITASHLTRRYRWNQEDTTHPIMHLVLGKDEISDKSKADWLLKSLAVLQIAWIIINVLVRHFTQLPISQIEIATIAFAIMAILIYLANWWKPKDVARPTMLQFHSLGNRVSDLRDRKQSFIQRFWSPLCAIRVAESGVPSHVQRVANDIVWLEGDIPLLFYLMAGSSLIFGGLHCLAWRFEFPTRVEIICWRVASLASAILPVVALAIAILGHFAVFYFSDNYYGPKLSKGLRLFSSVDCRRLFTLPAFLFWGKEAQNALLRMPKELRNWEVEPTADLIEQWGTEGVLDEFTGELTSVDYWLPAVLAGSNNRTSMPPWGPLARDAGSCKRALEETPEVLEFWRDYESFLGSKYPHLRRPVAGGPIAIHLQQILEVADKVSTQAATFKRWTERVTYFVSITNFILYTAARFIILALLFTSLRAAPAGVYQDTAWTRFLPKIS